MNKYEKIKVTLEWTPVERETERQRQRDRDKDRDRGRDRDRVGTKRYEKITSIKR